MAEYIEREALLKQIAKMTIRTEDSYEYGIMVGVDAVKKKVTEAPAADVAPVVRCKDCKHWEEPYCMLCKTRIGGSYHSRDMAYRKPYDFCSYGERKENTDD